MNKDLYRIVYNKARGLLIVVADIAGSGRTGAHRRLHPVPATASAS